MCRRLEQSFRLMVGIRAVFEPQMQGDPCVHRESPKKLLSQTDIVLSAALLRKLRLKPEKRTAADVDRRKGKALIHRNEEAAEAGNTGFIAQSLPQRLTKNNPGIFHRMVAVDLKVTLAGNRESEAAMYGESREHMIKKTDSRLNRNIAAVKTERYGNIRLLCGSRYSRFSHAFSPPLSSAVKASRKAAFSASLPAVTRR